LNVLLQVFCHQKLPQSLLSLLGDPKISFVGASVLADLKQIGKDFKCTIIMDPANYVNLGRYARKRDVVQSGTASLEKLIQLTLGEILDKSPAVRLSKWSEKDLSNAQKKYAALDVMKSLEVYECLQSFYELTRQLLADTVMTLNQEVHIVPLHGNVASMATCAGFGNISDATICDSPDGIMPKRVKQNVHSRVIKVTSVLSPSLVVPGYKIAKRKGKVYLGDLRVPLFLIVLSLKMLKQQVDSPLIRTFSEVNLPSKQPPARFTLPIPHQVLEHNVLDFTETDDQKNDKGKHVIDVDNPEEESDELRKSLSSPDIDLVGLAGIRSFAM
jgi:hypothetical protein